MENLVISSKLAASIEPKFWLNKRVLVTGHTGFKGSWLTIWLHRLGCRVTGISLPPPTTPSLFNQANVSKLCKSQILDIRDFQNLRDSIDEIKPDIIFHLAAQSLVRESYQDPMGTFSTNTMGTTNILESIRQSKSVIAAIFVTTDKVYRDINSETPYTEKSILGGFDPYSASKSASELIIDCYRNSFLANQKISIASARAGNVIGGGDWAKDRIIPDAIRAWSKNEVLHIRNPNSVRPWQHVLEPLFGYIILAQSLAKDPIYSQAYNFGPNRDEIESVGNIVFNSQKIWGCGKIKIKSENTPLKETLLLMLDSSKAKQELGIYPKWNISQALSTTINWYKSHLNGLDVYKLCKQDIENYESF